MQQEKYVIIDSYCEIKCSKNGTEYRWVTLRDIQNNKTISFALFSDSCNLIWKKILIGDTKKKILGEIADVQVTKNLLDNVTKDPEGLTISPGDTIELFIWHLDGWNRKSEIDRLIKSLKLQLYKYRNQRY